MKPKIMISQPMGGRTEEEIINEREQIKKILTGDYEFLNTLFELEKDNPVYYLAKSIEVMSEADIVIFAKDWENARGCRIEYEIAKAYGKVIVIL